MTGITSSFHDRKIGQVISARVLSIINLHIGQSYWPAPASAPVVVGNPTSAIDLVFAQYGYFNDDPDDNVTIGDDLWDDFLDDFLIASGVV